ncbi:MAG: 50S ribosomal protein L4, partial [Lentisphaeria bacterium]|nr:50S ribosomal protein L4 [Lentisphaeria bacterium]
MSKVLDILDCKGVKVGDYQLPDNAIELEKGEQAVHDAVVSFLASQRANTACTKTRAQVRGGGAKPTRQKGLGRARTGSSRSPVWTGGGVIFGPTPERNYTRQVNRKVMKLALRRAFSERVVDNAVIVLDKVEFADHKTKNACEIQKNLKLEGLSLLAMPQFEGNENVFIASSNIELLVADLAKSVNVYDLLRYDKLVFTKEALDAFLTRLN